MVPLENEDNLKNVYNLKNEDNQKNEDALKDEGDLEWRQPWKQRRHTRPKLTQP